MPEQDEIDLAIESAETIIERMSLKQAKLDNPSSNLFVKQAMKYYFEKRGLKVEASNHGIKALREFDETYALIWCGTFDVELALDALFWYSSECEIIGLAVPKARLPPVEKLHSTRIKNLKVSVYTVEATERWHQDKELRAAFISQDGYETFKVEQKRIGLSARDNPFIVRPDWFRVVCVYERGTKEVKPYGV